MSRWDASSGHLYIEELGWPYTAEYCDCVQHLRAHFSFAEGICLQITTALHTDSHSLSAQIITTLLGMLLQ